MNGSPAIKTGHGMVTALVIPPGTANPITLVALENSTPAITEAVGTGRVDDEQLTTCTGTIIAVHLDDHAARDG